ncbi:MAG: 50S ribosomal protein L18 [Nanoarchaeota archaeon]
MKRINKRRRREGKTDYAKRINLLKGGSTRIVFRKTNRYLTAQYVKSKQAKDAAEFGTSSKMLLQYGWPEKASGGLKSVTASYLLGILVGKKIIDKKKLPIIDFGMIRTVHKSRAYAFIKGLVDSGMAIKHKEGIFPDENRIRGEHLKNKIPFEEIKLKITNKDDRKEKK